MIPLYVFLAPDWQCVCHSYDDEKLRDSRFADWSADGLLSYDPALDLFFKVCEPLFVEVR